MGIQYATGVSMTAEETAEFTNPAINSGQLLLNAPSYLAAGNLPKINRRLDLLTYAYAQAINSPGFLNLPMTVQMQLVKDTNTYADALNASSNASLSQKSVSDATARTTIAWARQFGGLGPDYPLTPAETRANLNMTLAMIGSGIAKAKAKANDPIVGSAAEKVYISSRPIGDVLPELNGVNLHYVADAGVGVNTNCVSCVVAADRRLSGVDVNAVAGPSGGYKGRNDLLPVAPFGLQAPTTALQVEAQMLAAGSGSRGVVLIMQSSGVDHVINVVNRSGVVYFVDSQIGRVVTLKPSAVVLLGRP